MRPSCGCLAAVGSADQLRKSCLAWAGAALAAVSLCMAALRRCAGPVRANREVRALQPSLQQADCGQLPTMHLHLPPYCLLQEALQAYCHYVQPCSKVLMGVQVPPEVRGTPCCWACWKRMPVA